MMPSSVDLPAPLGPMIVMNSPSAMSRLICRNRYVKPALVFTHFSRFRSFIIILSFVRRRWSAVCLPLRPTHYGLRITFYALRVTVQHFNGFPVQQLHS